MAEDLKGKLETLEEEYAGQPPFIQKSDLTEINRLRCQLGMPPVDANLQELDVVVEEEKTAPVPLPPPDHSEARAIYQLYLKQNAELEPHRAYADRVAKATGGPGQTPVRPLALMGTGGGPLLCDHCRKPMVLEGGQFQGVYADAAWKKNPAPDWKSWISGGMVVEIVVNGTLRIYHGYPGQHAKHCCNAARVADEKAQTEFKSEKHGWRYKLVNEFLECEFPDMTVKARCDLLNEIMNTVYDYDPGIGVNRP